MGIGLQLKRIRELNNLSVQKFATIVGLNAERLRKWEEKDLSPRADDAAIIESFFKVNISDLSRIEKFSFSYRKLPTPGSEVQEEQAEYFKKTIEAGKTIGTMLEDLIQVKASIKIFGMEISELKSKQNKTSFSKEALQLEKSVSEEADRLYAELKRKAG